ncbi:hypothetical protein HS125_12645 [bacterium]|nr:hypothetical protein [bacterium]
MLHAAALVLSRPKPGATIHTLRAYETPSSTEWTPPGSLGAFRPTATWTLPSTSKPTGGARRLC